MTDELYIWIVRWDDFQHYTPERDRAPAWIKDYTRQLDDDRYLDLTLHQRGLLADLRREFSKARADLKLDRSRISARLGATVYQRDLDALNHAGFIEFCSRETLDQRLDHLYSKSSPRARPRAREEVKEEREEEGPPQPPLNGGPRITTKDLRRYTGCRHTRGTHGTGYKHDVLGTDRPPADWPHDKPTRAEIVEALRAKVPA